MQSGAMPFNEADVFRIAAAHLRPHTDRLFATMAVVDTQDLHRLSRVQRSCTIDAMHRLARSPDIRRCVSGIGTPRDLAGFGSLLARAWPAHALHHPPRVHGYATSEPHLTKTLAEFLQPSAERSASTARARAFLTALFEAAGSPSAGSLPAHLVDLSVIAEQPIGASARRSKRIDLLFCWTENETRQVVAIEVKFAHKILPGTLPAYRSYAQTLARPTGRARLFLVSRLYDRQLDRNPGWQHVSWFDLLRRWEEQIAQLGDTDSDFGGFRATLWQRL